MSVHNAELLFLPGKDCPLAELSISNDSTTLLPLQTAKNLGVTLDNQLFSAAHIAETTRSSTFALYNLWNMCPFLTREPTHLSSHACTAAMPFSKGSLLPPADLCSSSIIPAHQVLNQTEFSHILPVLQSRHWLPNSARNKFKTPVLADKTPSLTPQPLQDALHHHLFVESLISVSTLLWRDNVGMNSSSVKMAGSMSIFRLRLKTLLWLHLYPSFRKPSSSRTFLSPLPWRLNQRLGYISVK